MLNVHFHALWADDAFECTPHGPAGVTDFHPDLSPTNADVKRLARVLRQRVRRFLRQTGKLGNDEWTHRRRR